MYDDRAPQCIEFPWWSKPDWDLLQDVIDDMRRLTARRLIATVTIASGTGEQVTHNSLGTAKSKFNALESRRRTWGAWAAPQVDSVSMRLSCDDFDIAGRVYIRRFDSTGPSLTITAKDFATAVRVRDAIYARLQAPRRPDPVAVAKPAPRQARESHGPLALVIRDVAIGLLVGMLLAWGPRAQHAAADLLHPVKRTIVPYGGSKADGYFSYAPIGYRCDLTEIISRAGHLVPIPSGRLGCVITFKIGTLRDHAQHPRGDIGIVNGADLIEPEHRDGAFARDLYVEDDEPLDGLLYFLIHPRTRVIVRVQSVPRSPKLDFEFEQPEAGSRAAAPIVVGSAEGLPAALPAKRNRWAVARTLPTP